jgi:pyruvate-formate lyase-activating enzyme
MDASPSDEYLSCEWIEGGIAFNRRSIHSCLIIHHHTGLPFIAPFNGGTVPLQMVTDERDRIRAANKNGGHPACVGCPNLRRQRWERLERPIQIVGIAHYSHCNIKCSYCFLQRQDRASFEAGFRPYELLPTMQGLIDSDLLAHDAIIDWGGGEPTTYREIDALLELLLGHGTFHYLHTNGTVVPDAIRHTPNPERVHVICSVDAGCAATYQEIKERDLFEQVWHNLRQYIEIGVHVTPKYIMLPANAGGEDIRGFVERTVAIGATDVILDVDYNRAEPDDQIVNALVRLRMLATHAGLQVKLGFTGANFAPESRALDRLEAAYAREQLTSIADLLAERGYALDAALDMTVASLISTLDAHAAAKDRELTLKEHEIEEKEAALIRLTADSRAKDRELTLKEHEIEEKEAALIRLTADSRAKEDMLQRLILKSETRKQTILDQLARMECRDAELRGLSTLGGSAKALARAILSRRGVRSWAMPVMQLWSRLVGIPSDLPR